MNIADIITLIAAIGAIITAITAMLKAIKNLKETANDLKEIEKRTRRNEILNLINIDYTRHSTREVPPEHYIEIHELVDEYENCGYNGYIKEKLAAYDKWYNALKIQ